MRQRVVNALRYTGYILFVLLLSSMLLVGGFRKVHEDEPMQYGVTFSEKYAHELGLDIQDAYSSILQELPFQRLRLMSYWDLREPKKGVYDFTMLDWMMDEAAEAEREVTLAVGLRQPRWPECHLPQWAEKLSVSERNEALLTYIRTVVNRYKTHPALINYQLENEAANRSFGSCSPLDRELIGAEYALISELDPTRTIVMNVSNQSGLPLRSPRGEKVGFSIYEHAHFALREGGAQYKWNFYTPPSWHALRAAIIELLYAEETFIHELQAEPWGREATVALSSKEQLSLMNAEKLQEQVAYAEQTGMREIYLWGAEWWYWRQIKFGDSSLMDTAQEIFTRPNTH